MNFVLGRFISNYKQRMGRSVLMECEKIINTHNHFELTKWLFRIDIYRIVIRDLSQSNR